ncbi:MAG: hypothetical protein DIU69_01195 [Bacillota bacterium]|nr:MAG: hypothetical protein DIU69_01195 [Bacillota bacterium]
MSERIQTMEGAGIRRVEIMAGRADVEIRQGGDTLVYEGPADASAERQGETLILRLPRLRGWLLPAAERLAVTLPGSVAACRVETTGGVELRHLRCDCTVEVRAGNVRSEAGRGHLRVRSGAGNVEVRDHQGELDVTTGAGDVNVSGGRLTALAVRTGAGDVRFQAWLERRGQITTGAGSVELRPLTDGNADLDVRSGFGNIVLERTGVAGGRLELQTGAGSIHDATGIQVGRRGGFGLRSVDVLGPGDGVIRLATGAGSIRVIGKRAEPSPAGQEAPAGQETRVAPAQQARRDAQGSHGLHDAQGEQATAGAGPGAGAARPRSARDVLEALARGDIDVDEADRLLGQLEQGA